MKAEDATVGIGSIVERSDEVLERCASVVGKLFEQYLRFLLCQRPHDVNYFCLAYVHSACFPLMYV